MVIPVVSLPAYYTYWVVRTKYPTIADIMSINRYKNIFIAIITIRDHPFSTYAKFSEKLTFQTPLFAHVRVRIKGSEMLVFRKILRTY